MPVLLPLRSQLAGIGAAIGKKLIHVLPGRSLFTTSMKADCPCG